MHLAACLDFGNVGQTHEQLSKTPGDDVLPQECRHECGATAPINTHPNMHSFPQRRDAGRHTRNLDANPARKSLWG